MYKDPLLTFILSPPVSKTRLKLVPD